MNFMVHTISLPRYIYIYLSHACCINRLDENIKKTFSGIPQVQLLKQSMCTKIVVAAHGNVSCDGDIPSLVVLSVGKALNPRPT